MSIKINPNAIAVTTKTTTRWTILSLAMAGIFTSMSAQALLPTPAVVIDSGALADANSANSSNFSTNINTNKDDISANEQSTQAEQLLTTWRRQVKAQNLAQHKSWRRLLYFLDDKKGLFSKASKQSSIDDPKFFLSANGQQDSAAELDATLIALAKQMTSPNNVVAKNDAVICRFPARVNWLAESLNIDKSSLQADCPELKQWMTKLAPEQLSIMFAEEYIDNPISAFAHTLLRIDSKASAADFNQIDQAYALNDTVDGNAEDPFVLYAIKSISGGYNNVIEIDPYPQKLADYLKKDERDTWTYRLNLTPSEVKQIIAHVWETKDLNLPYYFTTDNCASEILRLIDVVRPQQSLLSQLPYVVVPSDVVNLLNKQSLLANSRYTPSDNSVRQAELNKAKSDQDKAKQANTKQANIKQNSLSQNELSVKLGYSELIKDDINAIKSKKLNSASSLSADGQTLLTLPIANADNNPLDRHPLQRADIGIGQRGDSSYIDVGVRAGFHDNLDRAAGYSQFFDLEALKATLRFYENEQDSKHERVELQNFTVFQGRSFNPENSAKKGKTWGASLEATQVNDGSQQQGEAHLVGSLGLEYGKSWVFGTPRSTAGLAEGQLSAEMPQQLCYALAMGAVQGGRGINNGFRVGAGINTGCRYQLNNQLRVQAELQLPYWYHGDSSQSEVQANYWQPISTIGVQYDIDRNQALRINANYDWQDRVKDNDDIQLSYLRYF